MYDFQFCTAMKEPHILFLLTFLEQGTLCTSQEYTQRFVIKPFSLESKYFDQTPSAWPKMQKISKYQEGIKLFFALQKQNLSQSFVLGTTVFLWLVSDLPIWPKKISNQAKIWKFQCLEKEIWSTKTTPWCVFGTFLVFLVYFWYFDFENTIIDLPPSWISNFTLSHKSMLKRVVAISHESFLGD